MEAKLQFFSETPLFTVIAAILIVYGMAIAAQIFGLCKKPAKKSRANVRAENTPQNVSIIIPFRNEAHNLDALLNSLLNQNYKNGLVEVILINDRSTDNWQNIVDNKDLVCDNISVRVVSKPASDLKLTSKQQALDFGVNIAAHPVLLFTDADMILAPNWIETLVKSHLTTDAALVFGHTSIITNKKKSNALGLLAKMEAFQLEYLFAFAYTFSKLGLAGSCMGNNLLITKSAYSQIGGQRGIGYSIVEDKALLNRLRKKKFKITACEPFTATAQTYPSQSITQFYNQITRWARGGFKPGGGLFLAGALLLVQNFCVLLSPFYLLSKISILAWANFLLTWIFLSLAFHKNRAGVNKFLFPLHYLFLMCEFFAVCVSSIFTRKITWKDIYIHNYSR